jgi:hypothetical protein
MSVVRDFDKLKRFNVEQLYEQYQANQREANSKPDNQEKPPLDIKPEAAEETDTNTA